MKDNIFKVLYYLGLPQILRSSKKNSVTVLNLHRISEDRDLFYNPIKPETFFKIVEYCCKHYTIISFEQINQRSVKPKLILSFDDGYYDFIECALPYLIKKGLPSNHNVVNDCINNNTPIWTQRLNDLFSKLKALSITNDPIIATYSKFNGNWIQYYMPFFHYLLTIERLQRNEILNSLLTEYKINSSARMMNWDDLKYCADHGVEIGSHSYNHDSLATIKHNAGYEEEIAHSITEINEKINKLVQVFAFPNGQYNNQVVEYLNKLNVKYILIVDDKINRIQFSASTNIVSRIALNDAGFYENVLRMELFHSQMKKLI